jgi:hypothetical protein
MTRCARYADKNDSPFKLLDFENRLEEFKKSPFSSGYRSNSRKDGFFFNYNGEYFIDNNSGRHQHLVLAEATNADIEEIACRYAYIDFRVKINEPFFYASCFDIANYDQFVKNHQEGRYNDR